MLEVLTIGQQELTDKVAHIETKLDTLKLRIASAISALT